MKGLQKMPKTKFGLKDIPKINDPVRRHLINFTTEKFYEDEIKEGLPFFPEDDLVKIENKYRENGITKKEIMSEIYKKGWQLKENTIKSYIQKGLIPRSAKRTKTEKGMISVYPANLIRHLNFTRYCLFSKDESIKTLLSLVKIASTDDKSLLWDASLEVQDKGGFDGDHCLIPIWVGIRNAEEGIDWAKESIWKAFSNQDEKLTEYLDRFEEIENLVGDLEDKLRKFEQLLESNSSTSENISLDSWTDVLKLLKEKKIE